MMPQKSYTLVARGPLELEARVRAHRALWINAVRTWNNHHTYRPTPRCCGSSNISRNYALW